MEYKNLSVDIQRMWNVKCFVIPIIIGTVRIFTKKLTLYLKILAIPGKHAVDSFHKKYNYTEIITQNKELAAAWKIEASVVRYTVGCRV